MATTEKRYPEWVQQYRTKGMTVKKKGEHYYLYKRTSKRVPGKKYPQPVDTYVGIITPDGVVKSERRIIKTSEIEVKEYGFSYALRQLCPDSWKRPLGKDWEEVLFMVIASWSPDTYLETEQTIKDWKEYHYQKGAQCASFVRRLQKEKGIEIKELEILKRIYLINLEKNPVLSRISAEQREVLEKVGVVLEVG